ncbi:MAG: HXXEE domain-containing protein, partial [Chloroflexota bacterium]
LLAITLFIAAINLIPSVALYLQYSWPILGLGGAIFIGLMLFNHQSADTHERLSRYHWILLLIYLLHQFEEHGVDLYGRIYYFHTFSHVMLEGRGLELTPDAILRINTIVVWFAFLLAIWGGRQLIWPGLVAAGLVLCNGLFHIAGGIGFGVYNPGLASAIVLFLPIAFLYFRFVNRQLDVSGRAIVGGIAFGVLGHAMLPVVIGLNAPMGLLILLAMLPLVANLVAERWHKKAE